MNRNLGTFLTTTALPLVAIIAAAKAEPVWAQENKTIVHAVGESSPGQATNASNGAVPQDIVVTAQRRSESLQNVPISVTAISPQQMQTLNLRTTLNLQMVTPGLTFDNGYGFAQTYIRGVGTSLPTIGLEGAVATYIDGQYLERNLGTVTDLFDVAQVQVLRGAQGTLYGRNATGGAILITTADPTDDTSLRYTAEYGNRDHALLEAVANMPLGQTFAIRLAARVAYDGNYVTNLALGDRRGSRQSYTVRAKAKWAPGPAFSAILALEYAKQDDDMQLLAERAPAPLCIACAFPGALAPVTGFFELSNDGIEPMRSRVYNANLRLNYDAGTLQFTTITSYRDEFVATANDQDSTAIPLFKYGSGFGGKTFTQEAQMSTDLQGILNGVVGVSYLHDDALGFADIHGLAFPLIAGLTPFSTNTVKTTSVSGFAEAYITPTPGLRITVGGRYTRDKRRLRGENNAASLALLTPPGSSATFSQRASFSSFTPRVVVSYDAGPANVYASWNRGFKAGGFSAPVFAPTPPVDPEKIDYFEVGGKYLSDDRRVRINAAAFYYKYRDIQLNVYDPATASQANENAGAARGYGFEIETAFSVTEAFSVFANAGYLDAKYTSYPSAYVAIVTPAGGLAAGTEDLGGTPLNRAPKWTLSFGGNLTVPLSDGWDTTFNAAARYSAKYYFAPGAGGPLRYDQQPELFLVNASWTIGPVDDSFSIGAFVSNLTNKKYYMMRSTNQPFGIFDMVARPRTIGARLTFQF